MIGFVSVSGVKSVFTIILSAGEEMPTTRDWLLGQKPWNRSTTYPATTSFTWRSRQKRFRLRLPASANPA